MERPDVFEWNDAIRWANDDPGRGTMIALSLISSQLDRLVELLSVVERAMPGD